MDPLVQIGSLADFVESNFRIQILFGYTKATFANVWLKTPEK